MVEYEVFAIRYAWRDAKRSDHFIGGDPHDGPMPMDYFTWVIRNQDRTVVVDTGFTAEVSARRGRTHLRCPIETLRELDIDPDTVDDVVLTHLHYDHVGNFHKFARARFHLQTREVEDVVGMVQLNFKGRVEQHDGAFDLAPGISLHHVGGHTPGLQIVRVMTQRGWVVLASDAAHYYEHMQKNRFFTQAFNLGEMVDGYRTCERLAASPDHIVPGHDPLVMKFYPAVSPRLDGVIVRLDVAPKKDG